MLMAILTRLRTGVGPRADRSRGQVLVIFALFLLVLFGAAALTIDYGTWLKARREYQNVADPAALAGSVYLTRPTTPAERILARRAAWEEVNRQLGLGLNNGTLNGLDDASTTDPAGESVGGYTVWVASPPIDAGAAYFGAQTSTTSRSVYVRIEKDNPAFLSRTLGLGDRRVQAWATAGVFPNRYAVITLRQQGQAPVSVGENIGLDGSNTRLEVVNGDVGGNWNMKLNSSTQLWVHGVNDNDAEVYLIDYISCGNSCWTSGQIQSGDSGFPPGVIKDPQQLPGVLPDPNYPLPLTLPLTSDPGVGVSVPIGDDGDGVGGNAAGDIDVKATGPDAAPGGTSLISGVLTCDPASPRIGPGYYSSIHVRGGACLILDPTMRHTSIVASLSDVPAPVLPAQLPGVFYVNGSVNVDAGGMIVGEGVTLIIRPGTSNDLLVGNGAVVTLNRGVMGPVQRLGAWTSLGVSSYRLVGTTWQYNSTLDPDDRNVGIALYVTKRSQEATVAADDNSNVIKVSAAGGLSWRGITYAPHDNVTLAGQPGHDGVGQLVSWTFKFAGGTKVKQTYEGPEDGIPFLIEPRTGQ